MSLFQVLVLSHVLDPVVTIPEFLAMLQHVQGADTEEDPGRGHFDPDTSQGRVDPSFDIPPLCWL